MTKYRKQKSERLLFLERERQRVKQFRIAKKTVTGKTSVLNRRAKKIQSENKIDKQFRIRKLSERNKRNRSRFQRIKIQLTRGKSINKRWVNYRNEKLTPLGACCRAGDLTAVQYLLGSRADPAIPINSAGAKPLDEACWLGHTDIVCLLVEYGAVQDGQTYGGLYRAIHKGLYKAVNCLIKYGCDVNEYYLGGTPLRAALTCGNRNSGDVRIVRNLLAAGANVKSTTVGGIEMFAPGSTTTHSKLAMKYSNSKCCQAVTLAYEQAK